MWSIYLNIDMHVFQDLNSNPTKDWGSYQEAASCRSQVLRGQTQPLTPAQPPVHQASLPKSTACRFMVHESHHICDIWWSKSDDEEPLINTKICWVTYPVQFDLIFSLQFVLPSNTARVSVMMLLWQKEVMLPSSVQLRAFQDQRSPGWKMGDLFLGSIVPRSWTREGCCRSRMLRCQTLGATPALLWTQQDRLTAGMTSVYTVRVMFSLLLFFARPNFYIMFLSIYVPHFFYGQSLQLLPVRWKYQRMWAWSWRIQLLWAVRPLVSLFLPSAGWKMVSQSKLPAQYTSSQVTSCLTLLFLLHLQDNKTWLMYFAFMTVELNCRKYDENLWEVLFILDRYFSHSP